MTTLTTLDAEYADLLRTRVSDIPSADAALLTSLAQSVDSGAATLSAATNAVARLAINTTDVAVLSYQFFTGATPFQSGLDYLISPTGSNPNNLNSAYYQSFNLENRFINFAVNVGKLGEGSQKFSAAYGALSLSDTLVQAYTTIFGAAPDAAKVSSLLNDAVPNGLGGTETREQYFAYYGADGANGIGTKAAMIGWLLAQAAKEDVGTYAKANDAFLADLGSDGLARFHVDLVQAYGPPTASPTGATIRFAPDQSVSPSSADPALRSTNNGDTITGAAGLNAGASVVTGDGNDTLTIPGVVTGTVTAGGGNDTVTLGGLGSTATSAPVLGAPPTQYGSVTLGGGNDTVFLTGGTATGTSLSTSGSNDVLHLGGSGGATYAGTITGFQTVYLDAAGSTAGVPATGALTIYDAIPTPAGSTSQSLSSPDPLSEGIGQIVVLQNTGDAVRLSGSDPAGLVLFLDHYAGAPTTNVDVGRGFYSANGGSITAVIPAVTGNASGLNGVLTLHVSSASTAGMIYGYSYSQPLGPDYFGPLPNLRITGAGSLTAQISQSFTNVDATGAGDLILTYAVAPGGSTAAPVFRFSNGVDTLNVFLGTATANSSASGQAARFVLGSGADTVVVTGPTLANLLVTPAQTVFTPPEVDGFKTGVDHLVLDAVTTKLTPGVQAYVGPATTLTQALINVSSHVVANTGAVFEFGGDTYVYQQDSTVGVNTGDGLIRLVGVTGLSTASGNGTADIHVHG